MKIFLATFSFIIATVCSAQTTTSDVWINEFHYDGNTTYGNSDINEFVEIVIKKTIASNATELARYKVILYTSGAIDQTGFTQGKGLPYNTSSSWYSEAETVHALNSFTACPVANTNFTILSKSLPVLQDVPAAIALVYNNTVIQLLSYEKAFKVQSAARGGGPAAGMTTSLITGAASTPVMETATTNNDHSISLLGSGDSYSSFTWNDGATVMATPCALNTNGVTTQSFFTTLPVRWISMAATAAREAINVQWKVATADDVDYYEIEMASVNAMFAKAGQVAARTSTTGNYQSTISNVKTGTYKVRIKSVLLNGNIEYSETRVVRLGNNNTPVLTVYPNPVKGNKLNVQLIPAERTAYTIQLLDVNGRLVSSRQTSTFETNSLNTISFDISTVPAGVYHIKVNSATDQLSKKIIVTK